MGKKPIEELKIALATVEHIAYSNTCAHTDTHRGGAIWTICDSCGAKWADDEGGFKPNKDVERLDDAFSVLREGIKANLDTGNREPMSVDQIEPLLRMVFCDRFGSSQPTTEWMALLFEMARIVAPLTVQQGFTVDWSNDPRKVPHGGYAVVGFFTDHQDHDDQLLGLENDFGGHWDVLDIIPRPTPKMRQKTMSELSREVLDKIAALDEKALLNACEGLGIPLETPE